jgi:dienelactone hydrolase
MFRNQKLNRRGLLRWAAGLGAAAIAGSWPLRADEPLPPVPTVDQWLRSQAEHAPLEMRFRGRTAEECRTWQHAFATRLRELLGDFQPPQDWTAQREDIAELHDHRREQLVLHADGHPPLPIYLLVPRGIDTPRAGVLALHGHGNYGYDPVAGRDDLPGVAGAIAAANYDYGRQLVRHGYVVAVPCLTPFGRRLADRAAYGGQDPCAVTFVRMQLLGKVLLAENLRDALWSLELLCRRTEVDARRLACVGLSYGGRMTMFTAAIDPRVRVAVISGALNVMQERIAGRYSCGAQVVPGLLRYGDVPEICSLIAPRYCLFEVGSQDRLIDPQWAQTARERIARAYRALDAEGHLEVDRFEGGHRFNGQRAIALLRQVLGDA